MTRESAGKPLTPKMQAFVAAWAKTSGNASEAYRQSYDTSRMDDATVRKRASELLQHEGVRAAIDQLRKAAADKAEVDVAWIMAQLVENVEIAMGRKHIKLRAQRRDRETGAVDVVENDVTDRDGNVAAKSLDLLARMVGAYEADNAQQGKAAGEAIARELSDVEFARWLAFKLANGAKQIESEG
jgi:phage terminase small subunit